MYIPSENWPLTFRVGSLEPADSKSLCALKKYGLNFVSGQEKEYKIDFFLMDFSYSIIVKWAPDGDPIKVDLNVATFAWNASRMSDLTDLAPTNGTDLALALCWLSLLVFMTRMMSQRVLWSTWCKIRQQNTEYFTDTIVTMRVAKDAVDADILVNNFMCAVRCRVL